MQRSPMETTEYLEIELLCLIIKLCLVPLQPAGLLSTLYKQLLFKCLFRELDTVNCVFPQERGFFIKILSIY